MHMDVDKAGDEVESPPPGVSQSLGHVSIVGPKVIDPQSKHWYALLYIQRFSSLFTVTCSSIG